jgi:CubicO group peptidase (beta-lactamase class C family)
MHALSRRTAMRLLAGVSAMPSLVAAAPIADPADWLNAGIRSGVLRDVHAVLISHGGHVVLERYYAGADESWGRPLGMVSFGPDTLHDLRSVTKSVVGLLYGIALDRGLVPPPEASLLEQFPEYPDLAADPQRARLTIAHALTMTLGMEWDEQRPYTDPANSEIAMENASDRNRFILERPFIAPPGERWIYSGGAVALLAHLIVKGSDGTLPDFARQALFAPLGITTFEWAVGQDGVASAASGLRLRPRDLLHIGELVLAGGIWDDKPIVSRAWLDASFRPAIDTDLGVRYGRLWYIGEAATPESHRWLAGFGNGGQRLFVMPDAELAAVMFFGAYDKPDQRLAPSRIWFETVLANLERLQ